MRAISCHDIITLFNTHVHSVRSKDRRGENRTLPPTGDPTELTRRDGRQDEKHVAPVSASFFCILTAQIEPLALLLLI